MKAFVTHSYGSPDVLELADIDIPAPGDDDVLVRVRATSVQPYDWHHLRGEPRIARLMPGTLGLRRPKLSVLGGDLAGEVVEVGRNVTGFAPGDEVYALLGQGGFAEYASGPADSLARMPANLSFEQAAAVPLAGLTALLAVRDEGRVRAGQRVLVNGASGGVGTFAVQLARALGAEVTGVCSGRNASLVRSIGAADVVDYTKDDVTRSGRRYDVLIDIAGGHSLRALRRLLPRDGVLVTVGGPAGTWLQPADRMFATAAVAPFVSQRLRMVTLGTLGYGADLRHLAELIESGDVTPVIDRSYPFAEIPAAVRYQEGGHARGKVVVTL